MKGMWVGYDVGCTMGLTCGHGAWQIDRQSSGSMWNSYSFQPVGQWMSYSFTDLGAEGCCRSLNALLPLSPPGWRGIVVTVRAGGWSGGRTGGRAGGRSGGRAGGCQTCGTHISVTAWWIFSVRSSMELSRPVVVHCHAHLPNCPIWACPWAENLSNLPQIGSRLCGSHISETAGWIYPI